MQLNMITPMDIGLERQEGVDNSDMFDLGEVEGSKVRRGVKGGLGEESDSGASDDEGAAPKALAAVEEDEEDDELSDDERKTQRLESNLDALYDQYHSNKIERDAKHKAKEERRRRDAAEGGEWHGITAPDSDEDTDVDEDPAPMPSDDDSDSDDEAADGMKLDDGAEVDDEEDVDESISAFADKSGAAPAAKLSKRAIKAAALVESKKRVRDSKLITKLAPAKPAADKSRQAAQWFDQAVFKGMPGLAEMMKGDAPEEEDMDEDSEIEDETMDASGIWEEMNADQENEEALALAVRSSIFRLRRDIDLIFVDDHRLTLKLRMMRSQRMISREPSRSTLRTLTWLLRLTSRLRRTQRNSSVNELRVSCSQLFLDE